MSNPVQRQLVLKRQYASAKEILRDPNRLRFVVNQIFASADTNNSGLISKKEFDILMPMLTHFLGLPTPNQQYIWQIFNKLDKNKSGYLSKEEFQPLAIAVIEMVADKQDQIEEEMRQQKAKAQQQRIIQEKERIKRIAGFSFTKLLNEKLEDLRAKNENIPNNLGIDYYQFNQIFMTIASFLQVEEPTTEQIDIFFEEIDLNNDESIQYDEFMLLLDEILKKLFQQQKGRFTWGDLVKAQRENIYEVVYSDKMFLRNCIQRSFIAGDLDNSKTLENDELPLVFSILAQQLNVPAPSENKILGVVKEFGNVLTIKTFEQAVDWIFQILIEEENKRIELEMRNKQKIS